VHEEKEQVSGLLKKKPRKGEETYSGASGVDSQDDHHFKQIKLNEEMQRDYGLR
jgi:hypothetical protein